MTQPPQHPVPTGSTPAQKAAPHPTEAQKEAKEAKTPLAPPGTPEQRKAREEDEKKTDELIKQYLAEKGEGDSPEARKKAEQLEKDQEKARLLNQIYNERYQPGVRLTPAQENAAKAGPWDPWNPPPSSQPDLAGQH